MSEIELFSAEFQHEHFESHCKENGYTYWLASDLMNFLGYETWQSFQNPINRAIATCTTLQIPIMENFTQLTSMTPGQHYDFKLSRFACYLVVMNADGKKPAVAKAQAYFATLAGAVDRYLEQVERVDRLVTRDEISDRERSLTGVANRAGVQNFAFFQNAGYRGMYNRNINSLRELRDIPSNRSPLDFMGKEELAANLFRMTQTELKIKNENISGQIRLEGTAEDVGREVRRTMMKIGGVAPEDMPKSEDIKKVKKNLKTTSKQIKAIDGGKKKKKD